MYIIKSNLHQQRYNISLAVNYKESNFICFLNIPVYSRSALHQILHQIEKYSLPQLNKKLLHIKESPKTLRYWCQFICLK